MDYTEQEEKLAGIMYDAYSAKVGGKAWNGDPLPAWAEFGSDPKKQVQADGWRECARVALNFPKE